MTHKVGRKRWQSIELPARPAICDHYILAFDVSGFSQTPQEADHPNSLGLRRPNA
jgi:hypothetical protein